MQFALFRGCSRVRLRFAYVRAIIVDLLGTVPYHEFVQAGVCPGRGDL
jgi:hypothetical protein